MDKRWRVELQAWLAPFLDGLRHKARARMCPAYVAGLIGAGDRKSVQPIAARDAEVGYDQLHHFIAGGLWDAAPLEKTLLGRADAMVAGRSEPSRRSRCKRSIACALRGCASAASSPTQATA